MRTFLLGLLFSLSPTVFAYTQFEHTMCIDPDICFSRGVYESDPAGFNYDMGSRDFLPGYYYFEPAFYTPHHSHRHHRHHHHHHHR